MVVKRRVGILLAGTVLGGSVLTAPAFAQSAQSTQQLQNEINALQQQVQALEAQRSIPSNLYNNGAAPIVTKGPPSWLGGIHFSFAGSYLEAVGSWYQHNDLSSPAELQTLNSGVPFQNSPLYYEPVSGFSAQGTRIAAKAWGDIDPAQHLTGYYEMDFLGAATTSTLRQTDSYTPRIRQGWLEYDNDNYHFHFVGGQQWSLATANKFGALPLSENVPIDIDYQVVAGFTYARQPALRFVEDWNKIAWFGISVEQSQTNFASNSIGVINGPQQGVAASQGIAAAANIGGGGAASPPGLVENVLNVCASAGGLNSVTGCSVNTYPDIIEKAALDPGWGHYEAFAIERFFTDAVAATATPNSWAQNTKTGWGVGGSTLLPVWPKVIDLQGSVLYGEGVGRYGAAQLPDAVVGGNGALSPITNLQFLAGVVVHPLPPVDVYAYYGQEQDYENAWNIAGTHGGFGNSAFGNTGCAVENLAAGPAGLNDPVGGVTASQPIALSCTANIARVQEFVIGFWHWAYKGDLGAIKWGIEYEYLKLTAFGGTTAIPAGGAAEGAVANAGLSPYNQAVFFSVRYYPFN